MLGMFGIRDLDSSPSEIQLRTSGKLINRNSFDRIDFVEFDEPREFIAAWPPERTAICGVDTDLIRNAAPLYAGEKPSMCFHDRGMTEHMQGTDGVIAQILSRITYASRA